MTVNKLINALGRSVDVAGCIVHFDRGSHVQSHTRIRALNRQGVVES